MEETFGGSDASLPSDSDINREIDFSSNSRTLNVDDANCVDFFFLPEAVNDVDQILGFSGLTDDDHSLIDSDIVLI